MIGKPKNIFWFHMTFLNQLRILFFYVCCSGILGYGFSELCFNIAYAEGKVNSPVSSSHPDDPYLAYKKLVPADEWIILSDQARIPVRIWHAPSQKAIVLALHGFNDSRDAWEDSASYFTGEGITLYAPDQRGFGQAPLRGGWAGSRRMIQDAREEIAQLKARYPDTPLYVMGESMGGAIAMCLATRSDIPEVKGYVLLAPAVWGHKQLGMVPDMILRFVKLVAPNWQLTRRYVPVKIMASDNNESLLRLYFDPLSLHKTRVKALYGLVALMSKAARASAGVRAPMLVLYGDHDQLVPADSMKKAWKKFPAWVRKDYVPGGYHLLLRDRNRQLVAQDIISWILDPDQMLPSGGDIAASTWLSIDGKAEVPFFLPSQADTLIKK